MTKEEQIVWFNLNREEKNRIYAAHIRAIKKKELYQLPDGNIMPYHEAVKLGLAE
jgi:hypothetical protein